MSKVNTKKFLAALSTCKPFRLSKSFAPILTHFVLDKDKILAFNDVNGIELKFITNLKLAIPGDLFLELLPTYTTEEIELTEKKETIELNGEEVSQSILHIKAGKSKMKTACLDEDSFIFEFPKLDKCLQFPLTLDFINGLKSCLISTSKDVMFKHRDAVRVTINNKKLKMYSTDGETVSRYSADFSNKSKISMDVLIPSAFCEELIDLAVFGEGIENTIYVSTEKDNKFIVVQLGEDCRIFSLLIDSENELDFEAVFSNMYQNGVTWVTMPKEFNTIIDRACILCPEIDQNITTIWSDGSDMLNIVTESPKGQSNEQLEVETDDGLNDGSVLVNPKLLKRLLPFMSKMSFIFDKNVLAISNTLGTFECLMACKNQE